MSFYPNFFQVHCFIKIEFSCPDRLITLNLYFIKVGFMDLSNLHHFHFYKFWFHHQMGCTESSGEDQIAKPRTLDPSIFQKLVQVHNNTSSDKNKP